MNLILEGVREAVTLLCRLDPMVLDAACRSLWISLAAVAFASAVGLPLSLVLARGSFPGVRVAALAMRLGIALPTVFVGIVCYALFSRRGPFGPFELLYTPWAIIVGEIILAFPIVVSLSLGSLQSLDERVFETARTLGAGIFRRGGTYLSEARVGVSLAILTAFSRCITELGIAMMVGGNIASRTRTLSTATALETTKGEFGRGLAMGLILLLVALAATVAMALIGRQTKGVR